MRSRSIATASPVASAPAGSAYDSGAHRARRLNRPWPMPKVKKPKPSNYRDAGSGRFVTKRYAEKHNKTTVKEPRS